MFKVSAKELFLWIKNNISCPEDKESLYLLLDLFAGISKNDLSLLAINPNKNILMKQSLDTIKSYWDEYLLNDKPIQYICGYSYWRDLKLEVNKDVLIPRSETEQLIDIVIEIFPNKKDELIFTDLGTGSGAIAIALSNEYPNWIGLATDTDKFAIDIAEKNYMRLSNNSNLLFFCGDWWKPLRNYSKKIDLAISNPPYIPSIIYEELPSSVKKFEPKIALDGGIDGLIFINQIIKEAPKFLKKGGWLILENHFDQCEEVKNIFLNNSFESIKIINDYFGISRFTMGKFV
tara:strand:+ start:106 stop:975 length:870 start_codon:yes stop_codon:yes gene_type:complete